MAIKLTTSIDTTKGVTTELYFHIVEFYRTKDGAGQFPVKYYFDETKTQEVKLDNENLPLVFKVDISGTIGTDKIEKAAYDAIGATLKAASLSPESDESGSWVAY